MTHCILSHYIEHIAQQRYCTRGTMLHDAMEHTTQTDGNIAQELIPSVSNK
jgi:hypothetical protein